MELDIIKIASDTTNVKDLKIFTHKSKMKNSMCGDIIAFKLNIKNGFIKDVGYKFKSCIYCQASASLLSKYLINKDLRKIKIFLNSLTKYYENDNHILKGKLVKVFNKRNVKRKDCIYLPVKTITHALNVKI